MIINIFNYDLSRLGLIGSYESISFTRHHYKVGEFQIVVDVDVKDTHLLQRGTLIMIGNNKRKIGIITDLEINLTNDGKELKTVKGKTLGNILNNFNIIPNGVAYDQVEDYAESVMRHYVSSNMIKSVDPNRNINILKMTDDKKKGTIVRWQSRYKKVKEEIEQIAELYELGWEIVADFDKGIWLFDVYQGEDRTINQDINEPVIFSPKYGNIKGMRYVESENNERNFAYVAGEGEGANRRIYEIGNSTGIDRKEIFLEINPSDEQYYDIPDLGQRTLNEYISTTSFESEIIDTNMFQFERDYDLGDKVTVMNEKWGVQKDLRIVTVNEVFEKHSQKVYATFGDRIPSLVDKVKRDLKIFEPYTKK